MAVSDTETEFETDAEVDVDVDIRSCPDCGAVVANVQTLDACPDCRWSGWDER